MGKNQSKPSTDSGAVKGLNFTPKQGGQPTTNSSGQTDMGQQQSSTSPSNMAASSVEVVVCKVDELNEREPREVKIAETAAVVVKDKGEYYAVGNKCSHYGAPLSKGAYCKGTIRCPWHGACFNVKTGDIEDYPGLDSLPVFEVEIRGDEVIVKADPETLKSNKRVKAMSRADPTNSNTVVLVGGGAASVTCAETLRQEGFKGRVVLVTQEPCLPYDRPKLSKALTTTADAIALRSRDFYTDCDIEVLTATQVTGVDTAHRQVETSTGVTLTYQSLLLATGGRPRNMNIPGQDLQNVCVLRTPQDANRIAEACPGKQVVIIGTSFIGLEVAAYVQGKASSVCVVGRSKVALQHVFGPQIGACITKLHEDKGVTFYFESGIKEFVGDNGHVTQAVLSDGTTLQADLCVLGVGVEPATDFLKDSGVERTPAGFVPVDKYMKTNVDGVFAGGDIVQFPLFINDHQLSNVQHWQMAHQHGRVAALNIMGQEKEIHSVPYFWTSMYGKSIRYTGYGAGYDDIVIHGDLHKPEFAAFFTKGDKVVAVASLAFDPIVSQAASLMEQGHFITKEEILEDPRSWVGRLKDA